MTPDWLKPMPWLQMQQQGDNPSVGQGITSAVGSLGGALMNRPEGRSLEPPPRKYRTLSRDQISRSAGNSANSIMGEPPPMY